MAKKDVTKARRRDFELQSSELWGSENELSAQFQFQLIGFEPSLFHFSFLETLHKKHVFRTFWGLSGGGTQWVLQKVVHACVTTKCGAADKNHPETITTISRIGSVLCR